MWAEQLMAQTEELAGEWMSRHGKMMWFPTAEETLHYNPVLTGITPGPTLYAVARIRNFRSTFDLFITEDTIQLPCATQTFMGGEGVRIGGMWMSSNLGLQQVQRRCG